MIGRLSRSSESAVCSLQRVGMQTPYPCSELQCSEIRTVLIILGGFEDPVRNTAKLEAFLLGGNVGGD